MKRYDNTDRLNDLIDQIDQTNVKKQKKGVLLFLGILVVVAFTTYLSFAQGDKQTHSSNENTNKANAHLNTKAKAQIISTTTPLKKINPPSENEFLGNGTKTAAFFSSGSKGVTQYLKDNILYPNDAFKNKIEGKVLVQVTINEEGLVEDPKIVEGLGYGCDEEVIRVVSSMPKWQPAKINETAIKKSYILTVTFSLS